jgi:integrase
VLKKVQRPASDDWPVFATSHAPSLWKAAREQLDVDVDGLVEDLGSIDAVLREHHVVPPVLTTDGARSVLKQLTEAAGIDVDEGYLQPHGARRGMIGEVYKRDRGEAQDLGRHKSMETTREAYSHLDAEEQRERLDDLVEEF